MSKTIFLTGATGYLGCHLAHKFLSEGHFVLALVRRRDDVSSLVRLQQAVLQVGELSNEALARLLVIDGSVEAPLSDLVASFQATCNRPVDEVWHSAAIFNFKPRDKARVEAVNIGGTKNMLSFATQINGDGALPRFFYVSTAYCAGREHNTAVPEYIPHNISDFRSIYEWSKHNAELAVQAAQKKHQLDAFVLRPSIIIGTSESAVPCDSGYYQVVSEVKRLRAIVAKFVGPEFDGNVQTRLLGDFKKPLNIVPIDFVVESMIHLANNSRLETKTLKVFNIVNEAPPDIGSIHKAVTTSLNIHGLDFVSQSDLEGVELTPAEKIINRRVGFQAPYMHEMIHFSTDCFREYVSKTQLPPPVVDIAFLMKLNEQFLAE